jgi:hypothetical protein
VRAGDLWIADRNVWTRDFLCDLDRRGAACILREHQGLPCEMRTSLRPLGRVETGHIAAQRVRVVDGQGARIRSGVCGLRETKQRVTARRCSTS